MRLLRRLGLRARVTLATTVVAAAGLAVAGVLMVVALERALLGALDDTAHGHGRDIAALVESDQVTNPLPSFGAAVAQVVDAQGRVRASTPGGDRLTPIVTEDDLDALRAGEAVNLDGGRLGMPGQLRVVGEPAGPPGDPQTVVVAVPLTEHQRSVQFAAIGVVGGGAGLTAALGLLSWVVIGRALRPVDELRAGADIITGGGGEQRLPVPSGDDELTRLAVTLNDMLGRLDAASERQRAFVADAAHELRSPITALQTELEVALHHPEAADPSETAQDALAEVTRMARLVDDLLVLAHLDDPRPVRQAEVVDLHELVDDVVGAIPEPRAGLVVDAPEPARTTAHRDSLRRVLRNLVDNAVRHARQQVTVTVRAETGTVTVAVADDGPGVPEADRERIFERFTRLDDARGRDAGGTGLGLAIAREIVHAHGGTLTVDDAAPGARFVVRLPAADSTEPYGGGPGPSV
ncbi:signal transduction histidine kinase [Haloactinopolyspora alba]|uniref:histidine kinase n=1 Tax=Haloactinopolyspora alba TaxID=648780 RepID=A0A2P8E2L9_9ACTN|nr:ATP-binding protein [Haloactinopolyspora alba]PSL03696.1 signal transduction histidine kinase [Haloactinopolyspora alba]